MQTAALRPKDDRKQLTRKEAAKLGTLGGVCLIFVAGFLSQYQAALTYGQVCASSVASCNLDACPQRA